MPARKRYRSTTNVSRKRQALRSRAKLVRRRGRSKFPRSGHLRAIRLSNADSTYNAHYVITGSDLTYYGNVALVFNMSNIAGATEMVNLFDNFRITKVLYRFVMQRNPDQVTTSGFKGIYPRLTWCHDFNDSTAITRNQIMQRSNVREFQFSDSSVATRWYSLNPSVLVQMYETTTSSAYSPKWRQWLDTSDSVTPHYGVKLAWDQCYLGQTIIMECKYVMEFKGIS